MKLLKIAFLWNICFFMNVSIWAFAGVSGYDVSVLNLADIAIDINEPNEPNDIPHSLIWSQPPIEIDPDVNVPPIFC